MRHYYEGVLWLQEQQLKRLVDLTKVSGTQNPADIMTKNLAREQIDHYTSMLGFKITGGRSETTAKLHSLISECTMCSFATCARWELERLSSMSGEQTCPSAPAKGHGAARGQRSPVGVDWIECHMSSAIVIETWVAVHFCETVDVPQFGRPRVEVTIRRGNQVV